jgi:hypothetical protein
MDVPAGTNAVTVAAKLRDANVVFDARMDVSRDTGPVFGAPLVYRATPSSRSPVEGGRVARRQRCEMRLAIAILERLAVSHDQLGRSDQDEEQPAEDERRAQQSGKSVLTDAQHAGIFDVTRQGVKALDVPGRVVVDGRGR